MRHLFLISLLPLVTACATLEKQSDYALQWKRDSVRLVVVDDGGKPIPPFGGTYIGVPNYLFTNNEFAFHPGVKVIARICPRPLGGLELFDVAPSVSFNFKAGHKYELSCKEGWPSIREIE